MAISYPGNIINATERTTSSSSASGLWGLPAHMQKQKAGTWPAITPAIPPDSYFNLTSLLLHADGSNGANNTTFVDSSTNAYTLTTNGKPHQGTLSPFSQTGWSNYFSSTSDYLSISSGNPIPATGQFTLEAWVFTSTSGGQHLYSQYLSSNGNRIIFGIDNSSGYKLYFGHGTAGNVYGATVVPLNQWNHVAVTRDSSDTLRIFLNGSVDATSTNYTSSIYQGSPRISGAATSPTVYPWLGYISNLKISGTCLYTGNFTPPTTKLTADASTQLLTCQDNRFNDNSTNAYTLTPAGTPSVQPFSPFAPSAAYSTSSVGGSIYFNGSSDYLSGTTSALAIGTSDFTVEFWAYKNNAWSTGDQFIIDNGISGGMQVWVSTANGTLRLGRFGTDFQLDYAYSNLTINSWNHFAYVRSGTSMALFVNGSRVATATSSVSYASAGTQNIGRSTVGTGYWNGYISNLRVVNGTAVYDPAQTTITVPTAPLTAITNTSLLLNATNAGIYDQTAKNTITTFGSSAAISTTQSKFGGSSMSFGGNAGASCLILPNTQSITIPASCDFTIECWVYTPTSSLAPSVWHNTSSTKIIAFYLTDSGVSTLYSILGTFSYPGASNSNVVRATSNIIANTWTHVAFVRSGSTITIYIDGTAAGTGTSTYATNPLQLVGAISTGTSAPDFYYFNGYIDDLRVTKYARYTGNFTPKTSAFENL
jgi:hypothetical protein